MSIPSGVNGTFVVGDPNDTPADGDVLAYDAGRDLYVSSSPSGGGGTAPDATTTTKGIVQLAGDLAGTATAPTVPGLAGKANTSHQHNASDVNAGTLNIARIPTGTTSSTVALGNHSHTPASIGAAPASHTHGAADLSGVVKTVNGTGPDGSGNVVVAGGGGGAALRHPAIVVHKNTGAGGKRWVHTFPMGWEAYATTSGTNNMNIWPLGLPQTLDVVAASVKVNTAAEAASLRVGIYADDGARGPGTRLLDLTFSLEEAGVVTVAGLSATLPAGDYWVAVIGSTGTGRVQGSRPPEYSVNSSSHHAVPFSYLRGGIKAVANPTSPQLANLDLYTGSWIRDDNSTAAMPNLALEYLP